MAAPSACSAASAAQRKPHGTAGRTHQHERRTGQRFSGDVVCRAGRRHARQTSRTAAAPPDGPGAPLPSLIPDTLTSFDSDPELQELHDRVQKEGQAALTREEQRERQRALDALGIQSFDAVLRSAGVSQLRRGATRVFQMNVTLFCNQACKHCHVESSPKRTEFMPEVVVDRCLELMRSAGPGLATLDITGGAPEYHPQFRRLVTEARALGLEVIDRCNLTVLLEPGQEDLPDFLASQGVRVVASLPCYTADNVDGQRGAGVFGRSIAGLQRLNAVGYGRPGSGLVLDLVYNPGGAFLTPPQSKLEPDYKRELAEAHGIEFNSLLCLNNMPIKRWADHLSRRGELGDYMRLLVAAFNPATAGSLMCLDTLSVRWDGRLYDCDFNQQLDLPLAGGSGTSGTSASDGGTATGSGGPSAGGGGRGTPRDVFELGSLAQLEGLRVATACHCFGCTAGSGSSCQGAIA